jgi:hypothetical protein
LTPAEHSAWPGRISRHLIQEALEEAIDRLKQAPDIEEPPNVSRRNDLHLDHDTKGLKGAPEIAHEIFKKIDAATVIVADVTPVGRGPDLPPKDGTPQDPKPLINSNIAIELGYTYGKLGTDSFLAVLNKAYGDEEGLPFDIIHRRHPIEYRLKENPTALTSRARARGITPVGLARDLILGNGRRWRLDPGASIRRSSAGCRRSTESPW